ncbi:MAG: hypothetical protein JW808_10990 [Victivallales bacterium]|nr:hypothetical protein [Victivallales bacterium]
MTKALGTFLDAIVRRYRHLSRNPRFFACLEKIRRGRAERGLTPDTDIERFLEVSYRRKKLLDRSENRMSSLIYILQALCGKAKIIVFHELIEELEHLSHTLRIIGIDHLKYHSRLSRTERNSSLASFRERDAKIILSCRALDEGLDIPDADVGIIAAASKTALQRIQRVGRMIRKATGKKLAWIITIFTKDTTESEFYKIENEEMIFGTKDIEYLNNGFII